MKKIITLITLFTSIISQAQYIEHRRFLVEANVGYSIAISLNSLLDNFSDDINFSDEASGLLFDASAYYRAGFDSFHLFGVKINRVDGKNYLLSHPLNNYETVSVNRKTSLTFIGPSYRREVKSLTGHFTAAFSVTPGVMFLETKFNEYNYNGTLKTNGLGISIAASSGYTIIEPLEITLNTGLDYAKFDKYELNAPNGSYYAMRNPFQQKRDLMRINLSLGLRYKL